MDCVQMLSDLKAVHTDLERDTDWLASRLSGSSKGPPGDEHCNRCESEGIIQRVHEQTPMKPIIKEYLLQKVDDLPGGPSHQDAKFHCGLGLYRYASLPATGFR